MHPKDRHEIAETASELLRVLSNPKRLLILCYLSDGELSVQQLQVATGLGQSTVSQQLAIMRGEKLVAARREAQSVYYSLESDEVYAIIGTLQSLYAPDPEEFRRLKKAALTS
ncbi:MAG: helix-turn-helix transcriptional regulator [Maritimibacter sp.]|nr:helix-turn-helix transcriptional regulator [Maritimibacter sp.]